MVMLKNVFPMPKPSQVINFLIKIPTYVCERRIRMKVVLGYILIKSDAIFVFFPDACISQSKQKQIPHQTPVFLSFLTVC